MLPRRFSALAVALAVVSTHATGAGLTVRPGREERGITATRYAVGIQNDGRINVTLHSQETVFANAYAIVWLEGEDEPRAMSIRAEYGSRISVDDRLGEGRGFALRSGRYEWAVNTYVTQPFITVQAGFINTKKKAVRVKALYPWCVGDLAGGRVSLGPNPEDTVILESGYVFTEGDPAPRLVYGNAESDWHLAAYDPETGRSLVAGFLTHEQARTSIRMERVKKRFAFRDDGEPYGLFRAGCFYDPPVEVAPGDRLASEVLYLAIAETSPQVGLERFGAALAAVNQAHALEEPTPHTLHAWAPGDRERATEDAALAALEFIDDHLKRYGWTHFTVGAGWEPTVGLWEPDENRFPHGMRWVADAIHARGMTAGICLNPFVAASDAPVVKTHPEWWLEAMDDRVRDLDITAPGAYEYVRDLCAKMRNEWGFDVVAGVDVTPLVTRRGFCDRQMSPVQVCRMGLGAARAGIGDDGYLFASGPAPVAGAFADGVGLYRGTVPRWERTQDDGLPGCADSLADAVQRYYFARSFWTPDPGCAYFGNGTAASDRTGEAGDELTWNQRISWLTGAVLTGGIFSIGDPVAALGEAEVDVLRRLTPPLPAAARPVDLFENERPRIWSLPISCPIGDWQVVAVFNWDAKETVRIPLEMEALDLRQEGYYTVYDFWNDRYHGIAQGTLEVAVGPGSVRLLGLRPYRKRPMFLATDRHISQGATDFTALEWNAPNQRLWGTFTGVADTEYNLRVLVPEPYEAIKTTVSMGAPDSVMDGRVLKIRFLCDEEGPVEWSVCFKRGE